MAEAASFTMPGLWAPPERGISSTDGFASLEAAIESKDGVTDIASRYCRHLHKFNQQSHIPVIAMVSYISSVKGLEGLLECAVEFRTSVQHEHCAPRTSDSFLPNYEVCFSPCAPFFVGLDVEGNPLLVTLLRRGPIEQRKVKLRRDSPRGPWRRLWKRESHKLVCLPPKAKEAVRYLGSLKVLHIIARQTWLI